MWQRLPGREGDGGVRTDEVAEGGGEVVGLVAGRRDREDRLSRGQGGGDQRPDGGGAFQLQVGDPDGPGTESSVLVMTLPVRSGATFTSDGGDQIASQDGVDYRVEGSFELLQWTLAISEVVENENFANPLPELSEGWEYRSFRVPGQTSDTPRAFLRVVTE